MIWIDAVVAGLVLESGDFFEDAITIFFGLGEFVLPGIPFHAGRTRGVNGVAGGLAVNRCLDFGDLFVERRNLAWRRAI